MPTVPIPDSYWVLPDRLLAGEYPGALDSVQARAKVRALLAAGISHFIDLTEEGELDPYAPLCAALEGGHVLHQRFPIRDLDIPTVAQMRQTLDAIDAALAAGGAVYVHCWGGIGRTGTVVGCWLIEQGTPAQTAIDAIERLRRGIPDEWRRSPETHAQRNFVRAWRPRAG
jgi:protein-tyrosine phosphatase